MGTVLIIDDSKFALNRTVEMFGRIPELANYDVLTVADNTEYQAFINDKNAPVIDFAFVDYNMPFCNGLDAIAQLEAKYPACHLVLLTATSAFITGSKEVPDGVILIQKPATVEKLTDAVLKLTGKAA